MFKQGENVEKMKKPILEKLLSLLDWLKKIHMWDTNLYPEEPNFYATRDSEREERYFYVYDNKKKEKLIFGKKKKEN